MGIPALVSAGISIVETGRPYDRHNNIAESDIRVIVGICIAFHLFQMRDFSLSQVLPSERSWVCEKLWPHHWDGGRLSLSSIEIAYSVFHAMSDRWRLYQFPFQYTKLNLRNRAFSFRSLTINRSNGKWYSDIPITFLKQYMYTNSEVGYPVEYDVKT